MGVRRGTIYEMQVSICLNSLFFHKKVSEIKLI